MMRILSVLVGMLILVAALAAPAMATNWIGDGWFSVDKDSVTRSGNFIDINEADCSHADIEDLVGPGPGCALYRARVNCRTHETRNMKTGETHTTESWTRLICAMGSARVPQSAPAATTAKSGHSVSQKRERRSDLELCETNPIDVTACTRIIKSAHPPVADLVMAYHQRCLARFIFKKDADDALPDCNRALALDPKSFAAMLTRGSVYAEAGRFDAAIADFTEAIALKPKDVEGYRHRARVYLRKSEFDKAIADHYRLDAIWIGEEVSFLLDLCSARISANVESKAVLSECDKAVQLDPKEPYAYEGRGFARLRVGDLVGARADADKVLSLSAARAWSSSSTPGGLYTRAIVNAREGKTMASYDDMVAAKKSNPEIAKRYEKMGLNLMVQAENAPFCPSLAALVKAAGERTASNAKADVAMPGATYCSAIDRGYRCVWETGPAQANAKQKVLATAAAACLTGYRRKNSAGRAGPAATFVQAKTNVTVTEMHDPRPSSTRAASVAVAIGK